MFGTTEGRKSLASSAGYERLAVVSLHRQHNYKGIDEVKAELSDIAMDFAPLYRGKITDVRLTKVKSMKILELTVSFVQIPFLSLGEDIGERKAVFSGQSDISGDFVVEDVLVSKKTLTRRLVFLQSKNCFQSEAKLIQSE